MSTPTDSPESAYHSRSDEAVLAAFVEGDEAAFSELVRRHQRLVYGLCLRYFRSPADAEDAAQDAFVVLYRRAETFKGRSAFSTWMYRLTMNVCNDIRRRRERRPQSAGVSVGDLGVTDSDDPMAGVVLRDELRTALNTLDPESRQLVLERSWLGRPYSDIAADHGLAVGTVKSRIHRAHAKLHQLLEPPRSDPGR